MGAQDLPQHTIDTEADDQGPFEGLDMDVGGAHLHRIFKQATGLTPKAYAVAQRAQRLRSALDSPTTDSVTDAIYGAGYQSSSRFYEQSAQVLGMRPSQYRARGALQDIRFAIAGNICRCTGYTKILDAIAAAAPVAQEASAS